MGDILDNKCTGVQAVTGLILKSVGTLMTLRGIDIFSREETLSNLFWLLSEKGSLEKKNKIVPWQQMICFSCRPLSRRDLIYRKTKWKSQKVI